MPDGFDNENVKAVTSAIAGGDELFNCLKSLGEFAEIRACIQSFNGKE